MPLTSEDWLSLMTAMIVGRIYENDSTPNPESQWFWALNGAAGEALQHSIRGSGLAPSLDAAKAAWRESYDRWLERKAAHRAPDGLGS
jgi:hypothetical protein